MFEVYIVFIRAISIRVQKSPDPNDTSVAINTKL